MEQASVEEKREFEQSRYFVLQKSMFSLCSFLVFFIFISFFAIQDGFKFVWFENFSNTDFFFYFFIAILVVFLVGVVNSIVLLFNKEYKENYVKMGAYSAKYAKGQIPAIRRIEDPKKRFRAYFAIVTGIIVLFEIVTEYILPKTSFNPPALSGSILGYFGILVCLFFIGSLVWIVRIGSTKPKE